MTDGSFDGSRPATPKSVAMIGGGQMALALSEGFCRAGLLQASEIIVYDPHPAARERLAGRVPGICFASGGAEAVRAAKLIFLAVKPQQAQGACAEISPGLAVDSVVVSIVAGLSTATLAGFLGTQKIVRVMPNTPSLVGRGVSVVCRTQQISSSEALRVRTLLSAVGHVHETNESLMNGVTGLSGSGPGFLAMVVEALVEGGVQAGLPAPLALSLAIETLAGTAALLEQTGEQPAQVRERVSSPGGTTLAGLAVLEQHGVAAAISAAVVAAATRAKELGEQSARQTAR